MPWAVAPQVYVPPTAPPMSPFARIDRDGYGYSGKKANHNAALSALALISFLFFLNLLQQQLSSGQQQTLLFMVNSSANSAGGRRRREATQPPVTVKTADKRNDAEQAEIFQHELVKKYLTEVPRHLSSAAMSAFRSPPPAPAPPTSNAQWQQLATWMRGVLPASHELPQDLPAVLSDCRDVVACTLHKARATGEPFLDETIVKAILASNEEPGLEDLREACEDLLEMSSSECSDLAHTFTILLPSLERKKHDDDF